MVLVKCAGCGAMIHMEGKTQCTCGAVVRRCVDCGNYDPPQGYCKSMLAEIGRREAPYPSVLSVNASCPRHHYLSRAA